MSSSVCEALGGGSCCDIGLYKIKCLVYDQQFLDLVKTLTTIWRKINSNYIAVVKRTITLFSTLGCGSS